MNEVSAPELAGPDVARASAARSIPFRPRSRGLGMELHLPYGAGTAEEPRGPARRSFTLRDLLIQAFYNIRLIVNCLVAGLIVGLFAVALSHTQYTADSLLLVFIGPESVAAQDASGAGPAVISVDGLKIVASEMQILQSDEVLRSAVDRVGPAKLFPAVAGRRLFGLLPPHGPERQQEAAVVRFREDLRVENDTGTNIVRVSFSSPDRARSLAAVHALVDSYLDHRRAVYTSAATASLGREIGRYADQLHAIEAKITTVRDRFGVLDITQDSALAANRLDGVVQRENQVRERRTAVHAELLAAQAHLSAQPKQVFDSREVTNNSPNDNTRNVLVQLEQQREHLASQYSGNWPALKEVDRQIAAVKSQLDTAAHGNFFTSRSIRNPVADQLSSRLAALQVEDGALNQQLIELDAQYQQADKRVVDLRSAESQLHDLLRSRDVVEGIYRQLSLRQAGSEYQDSAVDSRNANIRVVQGAMAPLVGRSMAPTYLAGGVLLGIMLAVAASVLATLLRQVYIMPSEAERDLDLPGIAEFGVGASDFSTPAARQEVGNLAAYLLDVTLDGRALSAIQVAAASDADGKSALVRALATELAQGHGLRTLILDLHGDGRGEAQALGGSLAGSPGGSPAGSPGGAMAGAPGLAERRVSVLEADVPVVATGVPQLWVSVDAARSTLGNARTLLSRSRELLDSLRQHFDMVLVIAPADLSDYASRRLSSLVDANLLVIRSEHTRAPVAAQLRDTILSAGGNVLGFAYTWRKYHIPAAIYRWL